VRTNAATNSRIVAELGFDRDTLLNTCFIEQKKLDRLEGLGAAQREASLKRLLNLDALVRLENDLKVRREDELSLERLRQRAELAAYQAELPGREEDLADLDARLRRVSAYAAAVKARDELQAALDLEAGLVALRTERDAARRRAEQAEALREAMSALREALTGLERAAEQAAAIVELRQEQTAAQALAETELPRLQAGLRAAARLLGRLQRLAALDVARRQAGQAAADLRRRADQARQAADELARARVELTEAEAIAAQAGHEQADLEAAYQATREAELLDAWLRADERVAAPERHAAALRAVRQRRADLTAEFREAAEAVLRQVTGYRLQVAGYRLQVSESEPDSAESLSEKCSGRSPTEPGGEKCSGRSPTEPGGECSGRSPTEPGGECSGRSPTEPGGTVRRPAPATGSGRSPTEPGGTVRRPAPATESETDSAEGRSGGQGLIESIRRFVERALELWDAFVKASDELVELEAARQTQAALAEAGREELGRVGQRARSLRIRLPAGPDQAHARLEVARARTAGRTAEALEAALGQARQRRGAADARLGAARDALERLKDRAVEDPDGLATQAEAWSVQATRLVGILERWQPRAEATAARLGLSPDPGACQAEVGRLRARTDFIAQELAKAAGIPVQIEQRQAEADRFRRQAESSYSAARARANLPAWRPDLTPDEIERLGKTLRQRYDELGGRQAQDDYNQAEAAVQRAEAERDGHRRASHEAVAQLRTLLAELKGFTAEGVESAESTTRIATDYTDKSVESVGKSVSCTPDQLSAIIHALADAARQDPRFLARQRDQVQGRVGFLREQSARLVKALGIGSGETLDLAGCRAALAEKEHEVEVRRRALTLVQDASRSLLEAVLPATVEQMTRLLPVLTVGRYFDAKIRPDDWKIRVWDERASADDKGERWRTKNIFSGGTKDQFSLALRLAFALAALPEERGAAPGFLFLDEPLGAFDAERIQALIALLSEGEVATNFDQILLISHVPVDRSAFTHHVVLEGGRVIESDLPGPEESKT
jgi:DNA repair exonuclease SbcCD ATPase subunit